MVHARSRAGKTDFFMGLRRTCQRLEPHSLPILPMVAHRSVRCSLGVDSNLEAVGVTPLNLRHSRNGFTPGAVGCLLHGFGTTNLSGLLCLCERSSLLTPRYIRTSGGFGPTCRDSAWPITSRSAFVIRSCCNRY